jgi:hypothetical protein
MNVGIQGRVKSEKVSHRPGPRVKIPNIEFGDPRSTRGDGSFP